MENTAYLLVGRLTGAVLAAATFAATGGAAWGQDAAKLAQMYHVISENQHYRVIGYHLKAGEKEPTHSHPNGVLVYWFTNAKMRTTLTDGMWRARAAGNKGRQDDVGTQPGHADRLANVIVREGKRDGVVRRQRNQGRRESA